MGFFKGFNFVRAVILLSVGGSIYLGYVVWGQHGRLDELRADVERGGKVERLVERIQENALLYSQLVQERDKDKLIGQKDPEVYIRTTASKDRIELGQVKIVPGRRNTPNQRDVEDLTYKITPARSDDSFRRYKIANFLYTLEQDSRRVRVTDVTIENASRKAKPSEIPPDEWTFDATITSRQKIGG